MKQVYLHIGLHKTGSSSIQESLFSARKELDSKGYSYLCEDFDGVERALPQKWINLNGFEDPFIKDVGRFNNIVKSSKNEKIIISIEALAWFYTEKSISNVRKALEGFNVKVIVYLRRQDLQMVSYHQEGSKGKNKPSSVYYGPSLKPFHDLKNTEYLDYEKRLSTWSSFFGRENLIIKVFDPSNFPEKDVVKDFLSLFSLESIDTVRVNESLGFEATKIGQLINLSDLKDSGVARKIRSNCSNEGKLLPSRDDAVRFYEQFRESNIILNRNFNITDSEDIFDDDFSMYSLDGQERWSEDAANIAMIKIFNVIADEEASLKNSYVDLLRNDAIKLEKTDLKMAYSLMKRALDLRPNGPVIKRKVLEYERLLGIHNTF